MNCLTARETLDLIRPQETQGDESRGATIDEAARHVTGCPACQAAVLRLQQIDARIGQLSRDVPVPPRLREQLLARLDAASRPFAANDPIVAGRMEESDAADASGAVPNVTPLAAPSRRRLMISIVAAGVLVAIGVAWRLVPSRTRSLSMDEIAACALSEEIKPDELSDLTQFKGGLALQAPKTMTALPWTQPVRRLVDPQLGDREVAVYFFTVARRHGGKFKGRLVIIPAASVKDVPTALSFPGPSTYRQDYCTTAWVEGQFVYLCCVRGSEVELHLLRPTRGDPA